MYILNYILLVAGVLFLLAMFFICFGMFHTPRKKTEPEQFVTYQSDMIRTGRHIVDADDDDEATEDQSSSESGGNDGRTADDKDIDESSDTNDRDNSDSSRDTEDIDDADNDADEKDAEQNDSKAGEATDNANKAENKKVKKNENIKSRDVAVIITFVDSNKRKNIVVEDEILIGRSPKCDVVINNSMVSAAHCVLIRDGEKLMAEDNNSTNGTMLNGKPLHHAVELKNNDVLTLGNKSIRINFA